MNVADRPAVAPLLHGRDAELSILDELLDPAGPGGALVLRGEAGIGKSALLAWATDRAASRGSAVLAASGVQAETRLPFSGLHQLLRPVIHRRQELSSGRAAVLDVAFDGTGRTGPDLYGVAVAVLDLLSAVAAERPVVLAVDDAQWLDPPTLDVLRFVGRRLVCEPLVLLVALRGDRDEPFGATGIPELALPPLSRAASDALLDEHAPALPERVRERLLSESAGNPLALRELPTRWRDFEDDALLPTWLPLTVRLEQTFAARFHDLPEVPRRLVLVAALNESPSVDETLRAASVLAGRDVSASDLSPAVERRLVDLDHAGVRFRHPLVRSAIRQAATVFERGTAHSALARVLADDDRRVWHLAAAALGPDEAVAAALDDVAARAQARGAVSVAVQALERAARCSVEDGSRGRRLLRAADLGCDLGRGDLVARLLDETEELELDPLQRSHAAWLRQVLDGEPLTGAAQPATAVEIARRIHDAGDSELALRILATAALRAWAGVPGAPTRRLFVDACVDTGADRRHPQVLSVLGHVAPYEHGAAVLERTRDLAPDDLERPTDQSSIGRTLAFLGDHHRGSAFLERSTRGLRQQGQLGVLRDGLVANAWALWQVGRWDDALAAAAEAERLTTHARRDDLAGAAQLARAVVLACRGDSRTGGAIADRVEAGFLPLRAAGILALVGLVRAHAALADGRPRTAFQEIRRTLAPGDRHTHPLVRMLAAPLLADAAADPGDRDLARALVAELEREAETLPAPMMLAGLRYARTVLSDDDAGTETRFRTALRSDVAHWPFLHARLQLALGTWLRRRRRVSDSRPELRAARDAFDGLGATPWSARARQELRATGERAPARETRTRDHLTPQEEQIAHMAGSGMTNREIGAQLHLSHRTVGSHLYRIFPKLGITARAELPAALQSYAATDDATSTLALQSGDR